MNEFSQEKGMSYEHAVDAIKRHRQENNPVCELGEILEYKAVRCLCTGKIKNIHYCQNNSSCPDYQVKMGELSS